MPVSSITAFIETTDQKRLEAFLGVRIVSHGHVGNRNIDYNISKTVGKEDTSFKANDDAIRHVIYDASVAFEGSTIVEQGLGQAKLEATQQ